MLALRTDVESWSQSRYILLQGRTAIDSLSGHVPIAVVVIPLREVVLMLLRRSISIGLALSFACHHVASAQDPIKTTPGALLERSTAIRLDLALGRIVAVNLRLGANRNFTTELRDDFRTESLVVTSITTIPNVQYELRQCGQFIKCDVVGETATIHWSTSGPVARDVSSLFQPANGPLRLRTYRHSHSGESPTFDEVEASSIWHLLLALGPTRNQQLIEMLTAVRPSWRIQDCLAELETGLWAAAECDDVPEIADLQKLIRSLGSTEFRVRQAADRQLRSLGLFVEPVLAMGLERCSDREQRRRIAIIRDALTKPVADSSERLVAWMTIDREVWIAFLGHPVAARRKLAAEHLLRLCDFQWEFDPHGDETTRTAQQARLRQRLLAR